MTDRMCPQCGKPITRRPKRGPQAKYCSDSCKARAGKLAAIADGRYAVQQAAGNARRAAERAANDKPCPYCGTMMASWRMQCEAPECKRRLIAERNSARQREHKERTGKWPSQRYERKPEPLIDRICLNCGKSYRSTRNNDTGCCSQACVFMLRRADRSQVVLYTGTDPRPVPPPPPTRPARWTSVPLLRKRWYAGFCADCGEPFIHNMPQTIACSDRCKARLANSRRRAVERSAFVENVSRRKIYERDGWRCQLCRKPVARDEVVPHPLAPVLDHIIPLAKGGTHEPANTQCAHFLCNSLKGDRGGGEQLLLIG